MLAIFEKEDFEELTECQECGAELEKMMDYTSVKDEGIFTVKEKRCVKKSCRWTARMTEPVIVPQDGEEIPETKDRVIIPQIPKPKNKWAESQKKAQEASMRKYEERKAYFLSIYDESKTRDDYVTQTGWSMRTVQEMLRVLGLKAHRSNSLPDKKEEIKRLRPQYDTLKDLAKALDMDPHYLQILLKDLNLSYPDKRRQPKKGKTEMEDNIINVPIATQEFEKGDLVYIEEGEIKKAGNSPHPLSFRDTGITVNYPQNEGFGFMQSIAKAMMMAEVCQYPKEIQEAVLVICNYKKEEI